MKNKIIYRRNCLILLQKSIKGYIVRKQHKPRYKGIMKIKKLQDNLVDMEKVTSQLKSNKENARNQNEDLKNAIINACRQIKVINTKQYAFHFQIFSREITSPMFSEK